MVVYGHMGYQGWVPLVVGCASIGVVLFFFLSGFLMGHHYIPGESLGIISSKSLRYWIAFLLRRFLRVYPPYVFAPVLGYLLLMPYMPPDFEQTAGFEHLAVVDELVQIASFKGNLGIYWTIQVELFFYLLYPLIISLCLLRRNNAKTLLLLFVALVLINHFPPSRLGIPWSLPWPHFWAGYTSVFVAGVFTAVMVRNNSRLLDIWNLSWNALSAISFVALAVVVALLSTYQPTHGVIWTLEWLFAPLFFILFISLIKSTGFTGRILSNPLSTTIGHASYSLYLVHIIGICFVSRRISPEYQGFLSAAMVLVVLTSAYYMLVERPFVILAKRIRVVACAHTGRCAGNPKP